MVLLEEVIALVVEESLDEDDGFSGRFLLTLLPLGVNEDVIAVDEVLEGVALVFDEFCGPFLEVGHGVPEKPKDVAHASSLTEMAPEELGALSRVVQLEELLDAD